MTACPVCHPVADAAPRKLLFRDLGTDASFICPECNAPLQVLEFATQPVLRLERCTDGHGLFFNPGELEAVLETRVHPLGLVAPVPAGRLVGCADSKREVMYRPCPVCRERMGHRNFGWRSGVLLDHCPLHGLWVTGAQLGRLATWWRAGGRLVFQNAEEDRARQLNALKEQARKSRVSQATGSSPTASDNWWPVPDAGGWVIEAILDSLLWLSVD